MYFLSMKSRSKLVGVNPKLTAIAEKAIRLTTVDFQITEGLRSIERQKLMVANGRSQTIHSKHLTGDAIDVMALVYGRVTWSFPAYKSIAKAMKTAAVQLEIDDLYWGGDWETFKDGPHFQIGR